MKAEDAGPSQGTERADRRPRNGDMVIEAVLQGLALAACDSFSRAVAAIASSNSPDINAGAPTIICSSRRAA